MTMRSAPHARSHGYDPGGTAIAAATVQVAELPPPWPKPVFAHPALDGLSSTMATPLGAARILAAVPPVNGNRLRIHRFDRSPDGAFVTSHPAQDVRTMRRIIEAELTAPRLPTEAAPLTSRVVLVCTQGTHDVCCGIEGTRLAMAVEADASLTVLRVSHTGGHRFAPTALTLPDGRMWANLDVPKLTAILSRSLPPREAAAMCRGWWGAALGPAQVAERRKT